MKIATWNVNSLRVRLPHVLQFLQDEQCDVIGLQETKVDDAMTTSSRKMKSGNSDTAVSSQGIRLITESLS